MECKEVRELLPAHADLELGLPEAIEIDRHLQTCPGCEEEIAEHKALRVAIKSHVTYFAAPNHLERRIKAVLAPKNERATQLGGGSSNRFGPWNWLSPVAALASVIAVSWSVALYLAVPSANDVLADEVVAGHVRSLMVNHIADVASTDQHTVKPWFNGKLGFSPPVKDLAAQGFPLMGGRLDYLNHRAVAALVYRHAQHSINVYIWPTSDVQTGPARTLSSQGYQLAHWIDRGMNYWAVSDVDAHDLMRLVATLRSESQPHTNSLSDPMPAS